MNKYRELLNTPDFLPHDPDQIYHFVRRLSVLLAPKGSGKTTFLQFLKLYYDEKEDASDLYDFPDSDRNSHRVIYLDFSDFDAKNLEEVLHYLNVKISELYATHIDLYRRGRYYLDALEGSLSMENITKAIRYINYSEPLILIDDITRPMLCSIKHGYGKEMHDLLFNMLPSDPYETNFAIILTGDIPNGWTVAYAFPQAVLPPGNALAPTCGRNSQEEHFQKMIARKFFQFEIFRKAFYPARNH